MVRGLEEKYINPFHVLADEECFVYFDNLLAGPIFLTQELGKKLALASTTEGLVENGAKTFHGALPETKLPSFKNIAKSATVQKNNKQHIVEVNRDILSWLANLSGHFRGVNNLLIDC